MIIHPGCAQVSNALALTCPITLRTMHLDAKQFYAAPFRCLAGSRLLIKYCVLDCEPTDERSGRFQLAEAQVRTTFFSAAPRCSFNHRL